MFFFLDLALCVLQLWRYECRQLRFVLWSEAESTQKIIIRLAYTNRTTPTQRVAFFYSAYEYMADVVVVVLVGVLYARVHIPAITTIKHYFSSVLRLCGISQITENVQSEWRIGGESGWAEANQVRDGSQIGNLNGMYPNVYIRSLAFLFTNTRAHTNSHRFASGCRRGKQQRKHWAVYQQQRLFTIHTPNIYVHRTMYISMYISHPHARYTHISSNIIL